MAMCVPTARKILLKQRTTKEKTMSALNEATKAEFQKLKDAHAQTGCLAKARRATNLTFSQLKELKQAGLVTGEAKFDIGSRQPRFIFKLTGIAA
jgi:hypothetical protein